MTAYRPDTFIANVKAIFGLMIVLASSIFYMLPGFEAKIDNVTFEIASQVTTETRKIEFNATNHTNCPIDWCIGVKSVEKEVDGEWVEFAFHDAVNSHILIYKTLPGHILPGETQKCSWSGPGLISDNATPEAGHYRITFSYRNTFSGEQKTAYSVCEFTVVDA